MKNVHNLAIELENIAGEIFNSDFNHSNTIFCADIIVSESFYEAVSLILFMSAKHDYSNYINSLFKYKRVNMEKIPEIEMKFEQFKSLLKE